MASEYKQIIASLPTHEDWDSTYPPLLNVNAFWCPQYFIHGTLSCRDNFKARESDIILASPIKSGTTWLKALAFATVHRKMYSQSAPDHPLLRKNPHDLVPILDQLFQDGLERTLDSLPPPRLLQSHMAYSLLPETITVEDSMCKLFYICRDPKDTFVSTWHFRKKVSQDPSYVLPLEDALEMFCSGVTLYGPVWEHQLEYWNKSVERPEKVLFLKYEDVKEDAFGNLIKIADFIGCPFSKEEVEEGIVEEIVRLCSFENLSELETNKTGNSDAMKGAVKNSSFFRKGKVGDWKGNLTPEMARKLDEITEEKFRGSGLSFANI